MTNEDLYNKVCKEIKSQMKTMNIRQKEMAEWIGMSYSQFTNKINNLGSKFNLLQLLKISDELNTTIDLLIEWGCEE